MRCAVCGAELTSPPFPGGCVTCGICGAQNGAVRAAANGPGAGPYRKAEPRPTEPPPPIVCPFCGGECRGDSRTCPHCDVRLSNVRCPACFALQATGQRGCARCGRDLELEPLLDPTDAPCPRCAAGLEVARSGNGDPGMHECPRCGGLFLDHRTLARIVAERESAPPLHAHPFERARRSGRVEADVTYVKCPLCRELMNRTNFGRKSGIVVDVCRMHGTWFDGGELTAAVEWVARGGLERARASERATRPAPTEAQAQSHVAMMLEAMRESRQLSADVNLIEALLWSLLGP